MKKVNNFQDEFSIQDIEVAQEVRATHNCGMSRIALKAPDQIYRICRRMMKEPDSASAEIEARTLKLHYAIQVWCNAVLISEDDASNLLYYWWLHWESDGSPFNKLAYSDFNRNIKVEQLLKWFWELLEQIADSGEIIVSEGYQVNCEGKDNSKPKVKCVVVLDEKTGKAVNEKVDNVYTYPYNREPRTFKWDDIKDFFFEMSLDQLRLTMPDRLHSHTAVDDILLKACDRWDVEAIEDALKNGANINCLDECGESVLQKAIEFFKDHDVLIDKEYPEEELRAIESANETRCKEIVELLLSHGADINLFGYAGMSPLTCAYYSRSPEMTRYLLERGASPNTNCYLEDGQHWPLLKNVRCTILDLIDELLYDEYGDAESEIEQLVREAGGRRYVWDFNPWSYENEGKYIVHMVASKKGDHLFYDNSGWCIDSAGKLVIEDEDGNQTTISLESINGLEQWKKEYQMNIVNPDYDWKSWKKRGYELACQVANLLPEWVALFYLYDNDKVVEKAYWHPDYTPKPNELQLCHNGEPIKIK